MGFFLMIAVFLFVLAQAGRIGPFVWLGPRHPRQLPPRSWGGPPVEGETAARRDPEQVLAMRLADGDLSTDEYLERLSVLQSR